MLTDLLSRTLGKSGFCCEPIRCCNLDVVVFGIPREPGCCVKKKSHEDYTAAADFGSRLSRRDLRAYWCASFVGDLGFKGKFERKTRIRGIRS